MSIKTGQIYRLNSLDPAGTLVMVLGRGFINPELYQCVYLEADSAHMERGQRVELHENDLFDQVHGGLAIDVFGGGGMWNTFGTRKMRDKRYRDLWLSKGHDLDKWPHPEDLTGFSQDDLEALIYYLDWMLMADSDPDNPDPDKNEPSVRLIYRDMATLLYRCQAEWLRRVLDRSQIKQS